MNATALELASHEEGTADATEANLRRILNAMAGVGIAYLVFLTALVISLLFISISLAKTSNKLKPPTDRFKIKKVLKMPPPPKADNEHGPDLEEAENEDCRV